jgi:hypothetical protein
MYDKFLELNKRLSNEKNLEEHNILKEDKKRLLEKIDKSSEKEERERFKIKRRGELESANVDFYKNIERYLDLLESQRNEKLGISRKEYLDLSQKERGFFIGKTDGSIQAYELRSGFYESCYFEQHV